jgi:hypothetical protein
MTIKSLFRLAAGGALAALLASPSTSLASEADELQALKAEIAAERAALAEERQALQAQRARVDAALQKLEARDAEQQAAPAALAAQPAAALPAVSAGESEGPRLELYGFAQMDAIYDVNSSDPQWKGALRPSKIPVDCPGDPGCGKDGDTTLSVRQSRFGAKGYVPTPLGELKTIFEFELFGVGDDAGETTFRLRHAWGELGQFGAGQTWSLFMNPDVFPNSIEYWGPPGMVFYRNVQARWTPIENETTKFAIAVEHPGSGIDAGKVGQVDPAFASGIGSWNQFPDVTVQYRSGGDWGHLQGSGILRALGVQGPSGYEEREFGWGINLSGALNVFEKDQILAQVVYGEGIANYMNDGGTDIAPNQTPPGAHAESVSTIGWLLYYNRTWNDHFTSSFGYSEHRQDTIGGQLGNAMETLQYATVNLLYQPIPEFFVGPEFIWGRRENRDGQDGTDSRIQFSAKYKFNGTIGGR